VGTFFEDITLENVVDRGLAARGYIEENKIDQPMHVLYSTFRYNPSS